MKALRQADIGAHVVNASYSDVVNLVLGKIGLAPTIGLGNIDLLVQRMRRIVSYKLRVSMRDVTILLVARHSLVFSVETTGIVGDIPYFLKILVDGKDVTEQFDIKKLANQIMKFTVPGAASTPLVSFSGVKNIMAILNDTKELTHSPGPNGLPGGYPVRLGAKGAEVVLPEEITLEEAIKINEEAQKFDGIERIEEDGTVVYTDEAVEGLKELLRMPQKKFSIEQSEERAKQFILAFNQLVNKYR